MIFHNKYLACQTFPCSVAHFGAQGPGGTAQAAAQSPGWDAGGAAEVAATVPLLETAPGKKLRKKKCLIFLEKGILSMELWKGLRHYMDFTLSIHYPHVYIYISTVFSIVFSRAKSTTPPTLHESSSRPQGSDRKGMKRSSGSNQTALNHAKHPIESRPSVVPYLGRHQQASPWITGNQRSLRFANMCCLVVTSLLSNLDWKDMEK